MHDRHLHAPRPLPRLSAACASFVMASHSSRITSLNLLLQKCEIQRQSKSVTSRVGLLVHRELHVQQACTKQCCCNSRCPCMEDTCNPRRYLNMVFVLAKSTTCSLTIPMPRSSDALSSNTMLLIDAPYICRATARMVEVLPVPGGP